MCVFSTAKSSNLKKNFASLVTISNPSKFRKRRPSNVKMLMKNKFAICPLVWRRFDPLSFFEIIPLLFHHHFVLDKCCWFCVPPRWVSWTLNLFQPNLGWNPCRICWTFSSKTPKGSRSIGRLVFKVSFLTLFSCKLLLFFAFYAIVKVRKIPFNVYVLCYSFALKVLFLLRTIFLVLRFCFFL